MRLYSATVAQPLSAQPLDAVLPTLGARRCPYSALAAQCDLTPRSRPMRPYSALATSSVESELAARSS